MAIDWIDRYVEITEDTASPEIFRLWSAISGVAGALERRVWARTRRGVLYPNLYVMLVAPPGVGKTQAMNAVTEIWTQQKSLFVAPKSMTKAAMVDTLKNAKNMKFLENNTLLEYHTLQIAVSELAVLINSHDLEFLGFVNNIFDNEKTFREQRRHVNGGKEIQIMNPQLNILAGAQPGFLSSILPEEAWFMGTTSRFIMVFAGQSINNMDLFGAFRDTDNEVKELAAIMQPWTEMLGQCKWEDDAVELMRDIHRKNGENNFEPLPTHPKLVSYNTRRTQFLIKLSIISAVSATSDIIIRAVDVSRARHWLLQAEQSMPDIFNAMNIKTDAQLIDEMHVMAWKMYKGKDREGGQFAPLPTSILVNFLSDRIYSERVPKVLEIAEKAGLIDNLGGGMFRPKPRLDLGQGLM